MVIDILYPAAIDNSISLPPVIDNVTPVSADTVNRLRAVVLAVEGELGVDPASVYGTVRNRLDILEALVVPGEGGGGLFSGDLVAGYLGMMGQQVIGFYGRPLTSTAPSPGQVYIWGGSTWAPGTVNSFTAANDLSGSNSSQTVIGLYNHPLASTTPINSAVPIWDSTVYDIRPLTQDDILPGFSITSFVGTGTFAALVETGATITSPSFTASYSTTPNSAQITNTDNIDSPLVLTTPFTSGTVVGAFHHTTASSTTFTLTAVYTSTKTANQSITWQSRSFGGVGTTGATSAIASGSTAVLVGATGTLANEGLHGSDVGQSYGPFNPSGQKIYLLMPHTASLHTFKDQNGFTFVMTAGSPTTFSFTNQNGAVISMDLYESFNLLSTTFTISVVT